MPPNTVTWIILLFSVIISTLNVKREERKDVLKRKKKALAILRN